MIRRSLLLTLAFLAIAAAASAGTMADAYYRLYWLSPGGAVLVSSADVLPDGSNVAPNNQWRYDYEVTNKSANAMYAFYAFYNSDDVSRAGWVSGTAPASWTMLKQGPTSGHYNFKVRYQTTLAGSKIASGAKLTCSGTFTWTGTATPGPQNYDAVNDGGSESGVTVQAPDVVRTVAETWGRIKSLYR